MRKIRRELDASSSAIPDRIEQSEPAASANQKPQSQQSCRVMNPLKTILVPVDFSTVSRTALDQAARLAGLNGASLHVLHLVDTAAVDIFLHVWREPELNLPYAHAPFGAAVPISATMAKWSRFGRVWGWVFWAGLTACFVVEAMQPGSMLLFWGVVP
jgi:hypothetical protein